MKIAFSALSLLCAIQLSAQELFPYQLSARIKDQLESDTTPWKHQIAAWEYSYIGAYREMLKAWDQNDSRAATLSPEEKEHFLSFSPASAVDYILEKAAGEQAVIINEAHQQPMHRVFTTMLLEGLYEHGFRFLGLETLSGRDSLLQERGYPIQQTGYYSKEPQFGNLIREALRIGFTLFPYEAGRGKNNKEREAEQARNIQKLLDEKPGAKVLIHCGFAHVIEGPYPAWEKAMAGWLKEFTGIDPLTINQDRLTERSREELHNPYLRLATISEPSVFLREDGTAFNGPADKFEFDLRVAHPFTTYQHGRPDWLLQGGRKKWAPIPAGEVALSFPCLVLAYPEGEGKDAVPVDIVELHSPEEDKRLALYPGKYSLLFRNAGGQEEEASLTVK